MTAITLNLLAEEQLALEQRARDPFKVAVAIGVFLSATVVALGALTSMLANRSRSELEGLQTRLAAMNDSAIAEHEIRYRFTEGLARDILTLNQKRPIMAPQLATVKDLIPRTIQLTSLRFALSQDTPQLMPPVPTQAGQSSKPAKPLRPKKVERVVLRLEGKAVSARPELEVDEFLKALREHPSLSAQVEQIQLLSIARAAQGPAALLSAGAAQAPAACFVIECRYKETGQ